MFNLLRQGASKYSLASVRGASTLASTSRVGLRNVQRDWTSSLTQTPTFSRAMASYFSTDVSGLNSPVSDADIYVCKWM